MTHPLFSIFSSQSPVGVMEFNNISYMFLLFGVYLNQAQGYQCQLSSFVGCSCYPGELGGVVLGCGKLPELTRMNYISIQVNHIFINSDLPNSWAYSKNIWPRLKTIENEEKKMKCQNSVCSVAEEGNNYKLSTPEMDSILTDLTLITNELTISPTVAQITQRNAGRRETNSISLPSQNIVPTPDQNIDISKTESQLHKLSRTTLTPTDKGPGEEQEQKQLNNSQFIPI